MHLTANFTLEEATRTDRADLLIENRRSAQEHAADILETCVLLERIRIAIGKPILINSLYRCPALNGSLPLASKTSMHMQGRAADIHAPQFGGVYELARAIEASPLMAEIDQLIYEFGAWVHVGLPPSGAAPRRQVLSIFEPGRYLAGIQLRGMQPAAGEAA